MTRSMTDITQIRLDNARSLAEKFSKLAEFADRIDRQPTQVSRFMGKNPSKNIGNTMARHIEACFKLPNGWMDQAHTDQNAASTPNTASLHYALTSETDEVELLKTVIATIEEILIEEELTLSPEQKAQAIIGCLKTCISRGEKLAKDQNIASTAIHAVI